MADWNDPPGRGEVIPLRAENAQTEIALEEDRPPGPSYVDLTSGDGQRRDVIPGHWRTWKNARRHVKITSERYAYLGAFHGVRLPLYALHSLAFAVWGVFATGGRLIRWWYIPGTTKLEWDAAANGLLNDHLRLHKAGRETRKARGTILALCLAGLAAAVVAMARFAPGWAWWPLGAVLFTLFALDGRPHGKTITTKAELPAQVQPPTQDVIIRALESIGIAEINRAIAAGAFPRCPARYARTGRAGALRSTCRTG